MAEKQRTKFTVPHLRQRKEEGQPISMVTAYDHMFTTLVDEAGVDVILVGDSVGPVVQGLHNTLAVTMDQMVYHVQSVSRARPSALVVGDMPFGSYQTCHRDAIANAIRLIQSGAEMVKIEGGIHVADIIEAMTEMDIPVMAHIGLTPQSYHRMGGNKVQGRAIGDGPGSRERLIEDALSVQTAGASAVVIEGIPRDLAAEITAMLSIPTIGIGAGVGCDGQVLVLHDLLGLSPRQFTFTKAFADMRSGVLEAVGTYVDQVRSRSWPDTEHSFD